MRRKQSIMKAYKKRIADELLKRKLRAKGAVLVQGPKWCGKTTTAEQMAASTIYMDDPAKKAQYRYLAEVNISQLLEGDTPRLIDEWQTVPQLWDAIRFTVDHREEGLGQFILTGSAVPADRSLISHSGTGRFAWLTMSTMTLAETGDSTCEVSLAHLFEHPEEMVNGFTSHELVDIAFLICRGGWPEAIEMEREAALDQAHEYVDAIVETDISRVDNVVRDADVVRSLMRSYARHQGAQATLGTIAADISATSSISEKTTSSYLSALKQIFVINDVSAWNPNLRSKTAIRTSDTRYFMDSAIAAASLGVGPDDLMNDLETMGLMFETLCMHDLQVYAQALDGRVYHYRDKNQLECDAVIHLRNGKYGLIEIKLGGDTLIEQGASTLKTLAAKIDTTKMNAPSFMMVLTAVGNYAYRRKDGVCIVPIGCLCA